MSREGQYKVTVRGALPPDLRERLSAAHAEAITDHQRRGRAADKNSGQQAYLRRAHLIASGAELGEVKEPAYLDSGLEC